MAHVLIARVTGCMTSFWIRLLMRNDFVMVLSSVAIWQNFGTESGHRCKGISSIHNQRQIIRTFFLQNQSSKFHSFICLKMKRNFRLFHSLKFNISDGVEGLNFKRPLHSEPSYPMPWGKILSDYINWPCTINQELVFIYKCNNYIIVHQLATSL